MQLKRTLQIVCFVVLMGGVAHAQPLKIAPLFEGQSRATDQRIPFVISGSAFNEATSVELFLRGAVPERCRIMRDPHHASIMHLKCVKDATLIVQVRATTPNGVYNLDYGPFAVKTWTPPVIKGGGGGGGGGEVEPEDPNWVAGRAVWNTHCAGCHQDGGVTKAGRSVSQLKGAVSGSSAIGSMKFLSTVLTNDDYSKLEAYLKAPGGG